MAKREKGAHGGVAIPQSNNVMSNVKNFSSDSFKCAVEVKMSLVPCLYISLKKSKYHSPWKQIFESVEKFMQQIKFRKTNTSNFKEPNVDWVCFTSTSHNQIKSIFDLLIQTIFLQIVQDEGGHTLDLVSASFYDLYLPLN